MRGVNAVEGGGVGYGQWVAPPPHPTPLGGSHLRPPCHIEIILIGGGVAWGWGGMIPARVGGGGGTTPLPYFPRPNENSLTVLNSIGTATRPDAAGGSQINKGGGGSERNPPHLQKIKRG